MFKAAALLSLALAAVSSVSAQTKPTYSVYDLPDTWETGQIGTNQCGKYGEYSQDSMCQNIFMNSIQDFCLWAPYTGSHTVGAYEQKMVSYCTKEGYGTRLIPKGTIKRAHFITSKDFHQVTGYGDFTSMHIKAGDEGGELDPHGATGAGNPPGGLVFTRSQPGSEGTWVQLKEWSNFMSATEFCFRACFPSEPNATKWCPHIYDVMGCEWNQPGDYGHGFSQCDAESGQYPGIYTHDGTTSTFYQGESKTPSAHAAGSSSNCRTKATISGGMAIETAYAVSSSSS